MQETEDQRANKSENTMLINTYITESYNVFTRNAQKHHKNQKTVNLHYKVKQ